MNAIYNPRPGGRGNFERGVYMIVRLGLFEFGFLFRKMTNDFISDEGLAALYYRLKNQGTIDVEDFGYYKELASIQILEAHSVKPDSDNDDNDDFNDAKLTLDSSNIMDYVFDTSDYVDNLYERTFIVKLR